MIEEFAGGRYFIYGKVIFAYSWSLLLTVNWFGRSCLRLKFGLVLSAYSGKSAWSFLLTVPLCPEIGF